MARLAHALRCRLAGHHSLTPHRSRALQILHENTQQGAAGCDAANSATLTAEMMELVRVANIQ